MMYVVTGSDPIFLVQWMIDLAQLKFLNFDGTGHPISEGEWNFIRSVGQETKSTLQHTL